MKIQKVYFLQIPGETTPNAISGTPIPIKQKATKVPSLENYNW